MSVFFVADLGVQIFYVHYKIGCFILLFYPCAYNGRSYRICLPLIRIISFVVYKMASNVNAEMAFLRVLLLR